MVWIKTNSLIKTNSWIKTDISTVIPPGPLDPLSIITSKTPFFYLNADLGVTIGTGVSAWADQSGNGNNFTQATGGKQPAYNATDSNFGSRGSVTGDGSDDFISTTWNPPAPGTTPIWFFAVFRQIGYTNGVYIMAGGNQILGIAQLGTSPQMKILNTTATTANGGAVIGTATRLEALFNNSTTDYLKLGSTSTTGVNSGNGDGGSYTLFARNTGSGPSNSAIACVGAWNGEPTSGEKALLGAWVTSYYGSGVAV